MREAFIGSIGRTHRFDELVLVIDDDPLVGEHIVDHLTCLGCRAIHVDNPADVLDLARTLRPGVIVIDQIVDAGPAPELLDGLDELGWAPRVVLIRYAHGPVAAFAGLPLTVVAGKDWFEDLPGAVSSCPRRWPVPVPQTGGDRGVPA